MRPRTLALAILFASLAAFPLYAQCLPTTVARLGGETSHIASIDATRVLVATNRHLQIYDTTVPTAPVFRGQTDVGRDILGIKIVARRALVVTDIQSQPATMDLRAFSVTGNTPVYTSTLFEASALDFDSLGNVVYVASNAGFSGATSITAMDVTGDFPLFISRLDLPAGNPGYTRPLITATPSRLFVTHPTLSGSRLHVINSSSPSAMSLLGTHNNTTRRIYQRTAGNTSHVYACSNDGLDILSLAALPNITVAGSLPNITANDAFIALTTLYVASGTAGISAFNLTNPTSPTLLDTLDTPGSSSDITLRTNQLLNADREGGFTIVSTINPANLTTLSTVPAPTPSRILDMVDSGSTLYILDQIGLKIYSLANPDAPALQGACTLPDISPFECESRTLSIHNGNAYITGCSNRLRVVNISNPAAPTLRADIANFSGDYDAAFRGNFGYFCGQSGLRIVDITNPAAPVAVGLYAAAGVCSSVLISGNTLYLGTRDFGLWILDISNPTAPQLVGFRDIQLGGPCYGLLLMGPVLYVGRSSGLHVLNVADRTNPRELSWNPDIESNTNRPLSLHDGVLHLFRTSFEGVTRIDIDAPAVPVPLGSYPGYFTAFTSAHGRLYLGDMFRSDLIVVTPQSQWKPEFRIPPGDSLACLGADFTLTVDVTANPSPTSYRWHKNGIPLTASAHLVGVDTPSLTIRAFTRADAGDYTCTVTNTCGATTSAPGEISFCDADFNCDAFLDFFDYDDYVLCFETGQCPPHRTADFNDDQFVDFFDYDAFVTAFETGC